MIMMPHLNDLEIAGKSRKHRSVPCVLALNCLFNENHTLPS